MSAIYNQVVNINNQTQKAYFDAAQKNLGNDRMTRQGFLRLMLEQLRNQDPTEPVDNSQMLQQQLSLEQTDMLQDMIRSNSMGQGASLVGKTVTLPDRVWDSQRGVSLPQSVDIETGGYKNVTGQVEAVQFDKTNEKQLLLIDGEYYDMELLLQVHNQPAEETAMPENHG